MSSPDVFDFADHVRFLEAWYQARKDANPRFSHRALARKLGSSDPSAFLNVLRGRRGLGADRIEALVRVVGLEGDEADYFRQLVRFGQAEEREERDRAWAAIADLRARRRGPEIDDTRFTYLSDRVYPVIRTLAECEGFVADPAWVARTVRPPIEAPRAAEALALLERLGFLVREGERLVPAEPTLRTAERVELLGSYGYHRQSHEVAGRDLERLWDPASDLAEKTAFLGFTVAVPERRLGELRRALWELQLKVMHLVDSWDEPKERVVQVNIQMFPASEPTK